MHTLRLTSLSLTCLASLVSLAGCTGSPAPTTGDAPPGHDAMKPDGRPGDGPTPDAGFLCRNRITVGLDNGHHNPGQNCQQGCHNHNFSMSGTMFSSANGGQPVVGASITFVDANGVTGDMQTNLNGNFWWSLDVAFPVRIVASMCPDVRPMNMVITQASGGCNQNGCHNAAGNRIHLP